MVPSREIWEVARSEIWREKGMEHWLALPTAPSEAPSKAREPSASCARSRVLEDGDTTCTHWQHCHRKNYRRDDGTEPVGRRRRSSRPLVANLVEARTV